MKPFYEHIKPVRINRQISLDFPLHLHDAVEIVYVLSGSATVLLEGQRLTLGPGDVFLSFPNQVHGYENTRDFLGFVAISTSQSLPAFQSLLTQEQPAVPIFHPEAKDAQALERLLQLMWEDRRTGSATLFQGYSQVLLAKILTLVPLVPQSQESGVLQAVLQYINSHYTQPLTRRDIAQAVGYSESHISHVFTEAMGISLREYLIKLRMDEAKRLLHGTDIPVSHIAMSLGFSSIRSFNRFFALQMSMTPTQYRHHGPV